ncbi:MAG: hypothetical protein PF689_09855 [Deltaproteobacteria bacterium]|nr:hypothetical protein [Deltaproteobacteria bacterium]
MNIFKNFIFIIIFVTGCGSKSKNTIDNNPNNSVKKQNANSQKKDKKDKGKKGSERAAGKMVRAGNSVTGNSTEFSNLQSNKKMIYTSTSGYKPIQVTKNPHWQHLYSVKSSTQPLEIRYGGAPSVLPALKSTCGTKESCQKTPSDKALRGILKASVAPLAKGGLSKRVKPFPMDSVRKEFSAHWGGIVLFEPKSTFAKQKQALAVIIFRHGRGATMFMGLYDTHTKALGNEWMRAFHSLRFRESMAKAASVTHGKALINTRWRCGKAGSVFMRFMKSTWKVIHISMAMAAMGTIRPYETITSNVTYLPKGKFLSTVFRIDNMERGDRTPAQPKPQKFKYKLKGKTMTLSAVGKKLSWTCKLSR